MMNSQFLSDRIEILRSKKGGLKLIHKGYLYTVHKRRQGGGIRWRCTQRNNHCKGSMSTQNGEAKVNMPHNHLPDLNLVALARCRHSEEEMPGVSTPKTMTTRSAMRNEDANDVTTKPIATSSAAATISAAAAANANSKLTATVKRVTTPIVSPKHAEEEKDPDEVCLRWNSHHTNMKNTFPSLLEKEQYVDVTLCTEGKSIRCHKIILSACSAYFEEILSTVSPYQHPIIFLRGIPYWIIKSLIDFMYIGEAHIQQHKLNEILEVAESLKIKGLTGKAPAPATTQTAQVPPLTKVTATPVIKPGSAMKITPMKMVDDVKSKAESSGLSQLRLSKDQLQALEMNDPLSLLKPAYVEETSVSGKNDSPKAVPIIVKNAKAISVSEAKAQKEWLAKKIIPARRRLKRKSSEHEPSPPPLILRKGTKSRPVVKAPKYYHMEFEENEANKSTSKLSDTNSEAAETPPPPNASSFDITNVKNEPVDIEENDVATIDEVLTTGSIRFHPTTTNNDDLDPIQTGKDNAGEDDDEENAFIIHDSNKKFTTFNKTAAGDEKPPDSATKKS